MAKSGRKIIFQFSIRSREKKKFPDKKLKDGQSGRECNYFEFFFMYKFREILFRSSNRKIGENIKEIIGKVITLNRLLLAIFSIPLPSTRFCFKHLLRDRFQRQISKMKRI